MGKKNRKGKSKLVWVKKEKQTALASSSSSVPPPPPWLELPREVTADILHRLGAFEILESAQKVCTTWRDVCRDPAMWRVIDMKNLGDHHDMSEYLENMCRHAVDHSQGQLTDIHIDYFATDELLEYISERSSKLRRLQLGGCYCVSSDGLSEAAKKFPLLEELHLVFVKNCNQAIEAIGRSCSLLKSFTLSEREYRSPYSEESNEDALAVAKSMPGLRHLRLLGNMMTNEGLQAILDGCPLLESLDIRECFKVDLRGDLEKRCTQQIKDLKRPFDSMEDCEYDAGIFDFVECGEDYWSSGYSETYSVDDYDYYCDPFGSGYDSDHQPFIFFD